MDRTAVEYLNSTEQYFPEVSPGLFKGQAERIGSSAFLVNTDYGFADCGLLYTKTDADFPETIHHEAILGKNKASSHWWRVCYSW